MQKTIDLTKTVAQLVKEFPEIKNVMVGLGFKDITSPAALMFMGKVMTIPKGAAIEGIPLARIVAAFEEAGFEVVGADLHAEEAPNKEGAANYGAGAAESAAIKAGSGPSEEAFAETDREARADLCLTFPWTGRMCFPLRIRPVFFFCDAMGWRISCACIV